MERQTTASCSRNKKDKVDFFVALLCSIKSLQSNVVSTFAHRIDQLIIVVRKDKVGNVHILVGHRDVSHLQSADLLRKRLLDTLNHVSLETQSRRVALLLFTPAGFVDLSLPLHVATLVDIEFDGVVRGRYSRDVPLEELNFAAFVETLQHDDEEKTDQACSG